MAVLVETINNSLGELKNQIYAAAFREYGYMVDSSIAPPISLAYSFVVFSASSALMRGLA